MRICKVTKAKQPENDTLKRNSIGPRFPNSIDDVKQILQTSLMMFSRNGKVTASEDFTRCIMKEWSYLKGNLSKKSKLELL